MRSVISAFMAGVIFALGLGLAGMTDPAVVLAFLDVTGAWNPSLAYVLGSALVVTMIGYKWVMRRNAPLLATKFVFGTYTKLDASLIGGSLIFGIGWGMVGYCPAPAIVALSFGETMTWIFVGSMLLGMLLHRLQSMVSPQGKAVGRH
jgi:uncharacterized membrane protein YedE/YeeE